MAEALEKIRQQFDGFLHKYEKNQKIKILLAGVFILIAMTGLIFYFTRTEYVVLYNELEAKQAGEVLNVLESNNIDAKIGDNSGTILVAANDEQKAQILVATEGLPAARFSYEDAFSGSSFMMTSEERAQRFLYAQQNYLASTIELIPGVRKAVVSLTVPEKTGFVLNTGTPIAKASVLLDLEDSTALDNNSVQGIAVLIANAVQDLSPDNVTIHGSDGRVLNQSSQEDPSTVLTDQLGMTQRVQGDLEQSITDFLSTVYGYGNVVVMANVKLGFDSEITEIVEFSPPIEGETEGIIRSMQQLEQTVVNGGTGGVPGTDTNTDNVTQYVENDENASRYQEASSTINYEINELRSQIVKAQGQIQDITVAVYINSNALEDGTLSTEQTRQLQNMISAAAGLDTRVVQVGVQAFNNSLQDQIASALQGPATGGLSIPVWLIAALAVLLVGAGLFAFTQVRKRRNIPSDVENNVAVENVFEEIDLELSGSQVKQQIERLVSKKPEAVAQLLRNWLSEE